MAKSKAASLLEGFNKLKGINESEEEVDAKVKKDGEGDEEGKDKDAKNEADGEGEDDKKKDGEGKDKDAKDESANDVGQLPVDAIKKVAEQAGDDDEKKKAMCEAIKAISESKHPMAKKVMEAIDDMTSAIQLKKVDKDGGEVNEDADGEYLVAFEPEKWKALSSKVADFGGK